jgi:glycerol 3-phosphatase-2
LPGNGSLVAALRHATGVEPVATGKPDPTMHRESVQRSGATNPIVVGDRLDTDIEGANAVGCASLLVLSGVTSPAELLAAPPERRPSFVAADLAGLLDPHDAPHDTGGGAECGRWRASAGAGGLKLRLVADVESGGPAAEDLDALRALCVAAWSAGAHGPDAVSADGDDSTRRRAAEEVLDRLGLGDAAGVD